jgi:hypothetical protein
MQALPNFGGRALMLTLSIYEKFARGKRLMELSQSLHGPIRKFVHFHFRAMARHLSKSANASDRLGLLQVGRGSLDLAIRQMIK